MEMLIKNLTRKTVIAQNCKQATTFMELLFGLHWRSNPPELLFKTRWGIHTLGLKKPIDVLVLSSEFRVRSLKQNLPPSNFYFWNPQYQWVLELPAGAIKKSQTKVGDQLIFAPEPQN